MSSDCERQWRFLAPGASADAAADGSAAVTGVRSASADVERDDAASAPGSACPVKATRGLRMMFSPAETSKTRKTLIQTKKNKYLKTN